MAIAPRTLESRVAAVSPAAAVETRRVVPVKWWAALGAAIFAFEVFVLARWVTGPYFETVKTGPSEPPTWMKAALVSLQVLTILGALFALYWFVVRPWRRERHLGVDSMLVLAFATLWFQDPLSAYGGHWFTYNSWLVNFGSWQHGVPGWMSFGKPGEMVPEPILLIPFVYVCVFVLTMLLGCAVMRKTKERWPAMGKLGLIGVCFAVMCAFDLVFEGIIFLPLGAWEYPGGHLALLFPDSYHKFPLNEMVTVSALFTAVAAFRFFVDDKGQTVVERGIERIDAPRRRKTWLRLFATIAFVHVALIAFYNVPNTWVGLHSTEWPADLQKRSYLTDFVCGDGTDRACPGPAVPLMRNQNSGGRGGSAYMSPDGRLVVPKDTEVPALVPFDRGKPGGAE